MTRSPFISNTVVSNPPHFHPLLFFLVYTFILLFSPPRYTILSLLLPLHFLQSYYAESKRGWASDQGTFLNTVNLRVFSSVVCQGLTTLAYIPISSFLEIVGDTGLRELRHAVYLRQQHALLGGGQVHASMKPRRSIFSMPERLELTKKVKIEIFVIYQLPCLTLPHLLP